MTENKRFLFVIDNGNYTFYDLSENGEIMNMNETEDMLNKLNNENEQFKKILNELSAMLQFDVENGIRSYPVKLSEYLSNALKELKE